MFTAQQLNNLLEAQLFKPFRIRMSDGKSYDVPKHDAAWVLRNEIVIGMDVDADGFAQFGRRCAILHITSIEDLRPAAK
jgi:hypothetical protein